MSVRLDDIEIDVLSTLTQNPNHRLQRCNIRNNLTEKYKNILKTVSTIFYRENQVTYAVLVFLRKTMLAINKFTITFQKKNNKRSTKDLTKKN